ncbi:MAG: hypothetical protein KDA24_11885 [Deltaproteobacteria bacterium]|nr:hypothetical protein [Deltaproteobacteria bacterium]
MTRHHLLLLILSLGLCACPTGGSDDDDAVGDDDDAVGDDDDSVGDDDDATGINELQESEPNDVYPFQPLGNLPDGRTTVSGTLETAGHELVGEQFFNGDLDLFTFRFASARDVNFSVNWGSESDDLDVLLFASLSENSPLGWNVSQKIAESASDARPETFSSPLSANVDYTILVGNWEGGPGATYLLTIETQ